MELLPKVFILQRLLRNRFYTSMIPAYACIGNSACMDDKRQAI